MAADVAAISTYATQHCYELICLVLQHPCGAACVFFYFIFLF